MKLRDKIGLAVLLGMSVFTFAFDSFLMAGYYYLALGVIAFMLFFGWILHGTALYRRMLFVAMQIWLWPMYAIWELLKAKDA